MARRLQLVVLLAIACAPPIMAPMTQSETVMIHVASATPTAQPSRATATVANFDDAAASTPPPPWSEASTLNRQTVTYVGAGSAAYPVRGLYSGPITSARATFGATDVPPPTDRAGIRAAAPTASIQLAQYPCPRGAVAETTGSSTGWWTVFCKDKSYRRQGRQTTYFQQEFRRYDFFVDDQIRKFVWLLPGHGTCVRWFNEVGGLLDTIVYADDGTVDPNGVCAP
jgi:hypothetical protein